MALPFDDNPYLKMAKYRHVHSTFWTDAYIRTLTPEQRYFFLYLLTNPHTNEIGIYELPIELACFETGYNEKTVKVLLNHFIKSDKIYYSTQSHEVAIKNWRHYNQNKSPKVQSYVNQQLKKVKDTVCIRYAYGMDTISQIEIEIETEIEIKTEIEIGQKTDCKPETIQHVQDYFFDKGVNSNEYQKFFDYYTANGWKVGKNPMKNWRAAANGWISRMKDYSNPDKISRIQQTHEEALKLLGHEL